jgi:hypothetical protein
MDKANNDYIEEPLIPIIKEEIIKICETFMEKIPEGFTIGDPELEILKIRAVKKQLNEQFGMETIINNRLKGGEI